MLLYFYSFHDGKSKRRGLGVTTVRKRNLFYFMWFVCYYCKYYQMLRYASGNENDHGGSDRFKEIILKTLKVSRTCYWSKLTPKCGRMLQCPTHYKVSMSFCFLKFHQQRDQNMLALGIPRKSRGLPFTSKCRSVVVFIWRSATEIILNQINTNHWLV